jgi:signal transduction histidine kinase
MEVQDTGRGISPENMSKLFTPFFTTKKEVKVVGLGLAVSYGIIQLHHGKIEVHNKEVKAPFLSSIYQCTKKEGYNEGTEIQGFACRG